MRKTAPFVLATLGTVLATLLIASPAQAAGKVPDEKACKDEAALKNADAVMKGGCVVLNRKKGNCMACHQIAGASSGDIAPPLVSMKQRFPDKAKLRAQINDARQFNPNTVMPPFGPHKILTQDEVDQVVEFVLTL